VGSRVLEGHRNHLGSLIRVPVLEERIPLVLTEPVGGPQGEVALDVVHRVLLVDFLCIAPRQQNGGSQVLGLAPEFCEDVTLELDAFHPLSVLGDSDGRDHIPANQFNGLVQSWIDMYLLDVAEEVPRGAAPSLTLPLVLVHPERVSVRALELRINIDEGLDEVVTGRNIPQARDGVPEDATVDDCRLTWCQLLHIQTKERNPARSHLEPRLSPVRFGDHEVNAARDWTGICRLREGYGELRAAILRTRVSCRRAAAGGQQSDCDQQRDNDFALHVSLSSEDLQS